MLPLIDNSCMDLELAFPWNHPLAPAASWYAADSDAVPSPVCPSGTAFTAKATDMSASENQSNNIVSNFISAYAVEEAICFDKHWRVNQVTRPTGSMSDTGCE